MSKIGHRIHKCCITDQEIIKAGVLWKEEVIHEDAPTMSEAVLLLNILEQITDKQLDMICPMWLRNRFVQLRKANLMKE